MKIVNPLYDKAFKYLMENEKYARTVLSVILDQEVVSVDLSQQETVFEDQQKKLSLFIMDFNATIRQEDGQLRTVLIELQKSKFTDDIRRFRNYLGSQYITKRKQTTEELPIPLVTIYLLGYELEGNPFLAVKSGQVLTDATTHEPVQIEDNFLKYLTHESYLIQVVRLPEQRRTRMERFFTLFNQTWVSDENYILDLEEVPEEFGEMVKYLSNPLQDEAFRRQLELEDQVTHELEKWEQKLQAAQAQAKEAKVREEEARVREEEERKLKEEAKVREEEANAREIQTVINLSGRFSAEEIAEMTTLSIEKVEGILSRQ